MQVFRSVAGYQTCMCKRSINLNPNMNNIYNQNFRICGSNACLFFIKCKKSEGKNLRYGTIFATFKITPISKIFWLNQGTFLNKRNFHPFQSGSCGNL